MQLNLILAVSVFSLCYSCRVNYLKFLLMPSYLRFTCTSRFLSSLGFVFWKLLPCKMCEADQEADGPGFNGRLFWTWIKLTIFWNMLCHVPVKKKWHQWVSVGAVNLAGYLTNTFWGKKFSRNVYFPFLWNSIRWMINLLLSFNVS